MLCQDEEDIIPFSLLHVLQLNSDSVDLEIVSDPTVEGSFKTVPTLSLPVARTKLFYPSYDWCIHNTLLGFSLFP